MARAVVSRRCRRARARHRQWAGVFAGRRAGVAAHVSWTAHAASRAAIASAAVALATDNNTSSVAGLVTSKVDAAERSSPPIHKPVGTDANTRETSELAIGQ